MAAKKTMHPHPDQVALYDELIESAPDIDRKGASMPYTSVNGHMFSFMDKEGHMSLRLNQTDIEAFIATHKSSHSIQHGRTMKEFVIVPNSLLGKTKELLGYFMSSYNYVKSLKPKTKKKN